MRIPSTRFQFGMRPLLLAMAVFAVCSAVIRVSPYTGIAMALMACPAFVRTYIECRRFQAQGRPIRLWSTLLVFLVGLLVTPIFIATLSITFCVVALTGFALAFPIFLTNVPFWVSNACSGILIVAAATISFRVAVRVFRDLWTLDEWGLCRR